MEENKEYYESLDKRTNEYKQWKESQTVKVSHKIGDKVESILEATGISKLVKFIAGEDCNCAERKAKLNDMFGYTVLCLTEDEHNYLDNFFTGNPQEIQPSEYIKITSIASRVLNKRIDASMGCGGCVRGVVKQMKQIYESYEG
ncbi:hypothetical protein N9F18_00860 [bacterium]|nr:hypothetical protein [bacterium]